MLNHRIRGLLFHYKKKKIAIGFYSVSVFSNKILSMSSSLSCPISVCSVVPVCSVKSVSVNKSSSSLKMSSPKDPNKSKLGSSQELG